MQPRDFEWSRAMRGLAVLVILAALVPPGWSQDKKPLPKPLPNTIVQAWKAAGAEVGWMRVHPHGVLDFIGAAKGEPGDVPAFRFESWRENVLRKLPAPAGSFGLDLVLSEVTDAGLQELAGLKSLQSLNLSNNKLTDMGLKELAGLKSLQSLDIGNTQVADAGLKELARLKSLQSLDIGNTQVADAGLKELARLKSLQRLFLYGTNVSDAGLKDLAGL